MEGDRSVAMAPFSVMAVPPRVLPSPGGLTAAVRMCLMIPVPRLAFGANHLNFSKRYQGGDS